MGLTGKITPDQVAKKWDNLKSKFKVTLPRDGPPAVLQHD